MESTLLDCAARLPFGCRWRRHSGTGYLRASAATGDRPSGGGDYVGVRPVARPPSEQPGASLRLTSQRLHVLRRPRTYVALRHGKVTRDDIDALPDYASSHRFSPAERAALRYVEEINSQHTATDDSFATLRQHFSERQIIELTWLNAIGNYLNLQARPLGFGAEGYCNLPAR